MVRFFIDGKRADIDAKTMINFNYSSVDTTNPTSVKGSFSKTVELPSTKSNDEIFEGMFDIKQVTASFKPNARTPFTLECDGKTEQGYIKLDKVVRLGGKVTYQCTLFTELGDFFYNLAYGEDGKARSFSNMRFNFLDGNGAPMSAEDENSKTLFNWDSEYIKESWENLSSFIPNQPNVDPKTVITAAPVYHGYPDDLDCKKMIVEYTGLDDYSKELLGDFPEKYNLFSRARNWVIVENDRDLDEFEARNLRSSSMSPAIRCRALMDAICNKDNNGGYEVVFDDSVVNSPYMNDTWLIMSKIDLEENGKAAEYDLTMDAVISDGYMPISARFKSADVIDTTTMKDPKANVSLALNLRLSKLVENVYTSYTHRVKVGRKYELTHVSGGFWFRLKVVDGDNVTYSRTSFYTTSHGDFTVTGDDEGFRAYQVDAIKRLAVLAGCKEGDFVMNTADFIVNGEQFVGLEKPVELECDVPLSKSLELYLEAGYISVSNREGYHPLSTRENDGQYFPIGYTATIQNHTENATNGIYTGVVPVLQKTAITKKTLFSDVMSPYEFLVGWCRIQGLRFLVDGKTIRIMPREKYYTGEVQVLDGLIDLSQNIEIKPVVADSKWVKYEMETPETYAAKIYKKKTDSPYGSLTVDTGYYFNNDTKEVLDGVKFENAIPYRLNSIYFNGIDIPAPMISPTFQRTLYESDSVADDKKIDSADKTKVMLGYSIDFDTFRVYDSVPRLCLFGDDNKPEDVKNCLAFFSGFDGGATYLLTDNLQICEDIAGGQCYVYSRDGGGFPSLESEEWGTIGYRVSKLPVFTKYLSNSDGNYTFSLDFEKPQYTFLGDDSRYGSSSTIFSRYWKKYIDDIYDRDNRQVTVRTMLHGSANDLLRRFYYFEGGLWVLDSLTDYAYLTDKPQSATFSRVKDITAWTDSELVWFKDIVFEDRYPEYKSDETYNWNIVIKCISDETMLDLGLVADNTREGCALLMVKIDDTLLKPSSLVVENGRYYIPTSRVGSHTVRLLYENGTLPYQAFQGIGWFDEVTVTRFTRKIEDGCFRYNSLRTLLVDCRNVEIGWQAFERCADLESVEITGSYSLANGCFGQDGKISRLKLNPDGCEAWDTYTFINCHSLLKVEIPEVEVIPEGAFHNCYNLKVVTIPDTVRRIDRSAFWHTALVSVTIPPSVLAIADSAFGDTPYLDSVTIESKTSAPSFMGFEAFKGTRYGGTLTYWDTADIGDWLSKEQYYLGYYNWNANILNNPDKPKVRRKVTYMIEGNIYRVDEYYPGDTIVTPDAPDIEGYSFKGFENLPVGNIMPDYDISVVMVYEEITVKTYEVKYWVDGSVWNVEEYKPGDMITSPTAPEKDGYYFKRWDGLPLVMPEYNVNAYAVYEVREAVMRKVTLYVDGAVWQTLNFLEGERIVVPDGPEKADYEFVRWDGLPSVMGMFNVNAYAVYEELNLVVNYYVDNELIGSVRQYEGERIDAPQAPVKPGQRFNVWIYELDGQWVNLPEYMPKYSIDCHAHYIQIPYEEQYLTFEALKYGAFSFTQNGYGDGIQYSRDNGVTWNHLAPGGTVIVYEGDKILWKSALKPGNFAFGIGCFGSYSDFSVYGNVMSLLYGDDFKGKTDLMYDSVFYGLFSDCTELWYAANLVLPALNLTYACYRYMFSGCASLLSTPELPATTLADCCYYGMFSNCNRNLTTAPELPATTLAHSCYYEMFSHCRNLTTAPELPATTLAHSCYAKMFRGCKELSEVTMLATENVQSLTIDYWLEDTAKSGTVYKNPDLLTNLSQYVPDGWDVVDYQG